MKKVNLFNADKGFTADVARFMCKNIWRAEYSLRLRKALEKDESQIAILENMLENGTDLMTDEQIHARIEELHDHQLKLSTAYNEVSNHWTKVVPSESMVSAYKTYAEGKPVNAFVELFKANGLEVSEDTEIVQTLVKAVSGDSSGQRSKSLRSACNGGNWAVEIHSKNEFVTIVYRRLADYMVNSGTIRCVGNTVRGGGEDIAEFVVEFGQFTKVKYAPRQKKSDK